MTLIWLVLMHALVQPGLLVGSPGAVGEQLLRVICEPHQACVTDMGCCCEAEPTDDIPAPEPIQLPTRGTDLVAIPTPSVSITFVVEAFSEAGWSLPTRGIEPEAHLRRLSRLCVWRT